MVQDLWWQLESLGSMMFNIFFLPLLILIAYRRNLVQFWAHRRNLVQFCCLYLINHHDPHRTMICIKFWIPLISYLFNELTSTIFVLNIQCLPYDKDIKNRHHIDQFIMAISCWSPLQLGSGDGSAPQPQRVRAPGKTPAVSEKWEVPTHDGGSVNRLFVVISYSCSLLMIINWLVSYDFIGYLRQLSGYDWSVWSTPTVFMNFESTTLKSRRFTKNPRY